MSEALDRLLHDAEHADSGEMMANAMRDRDAARRFTEQRSSLLRMALALDPQQLAPEWDDLRWSRIQAKIFAYPNSDPNASHSPEADR